MILQRHERRNGPVSDIGRWLFDHLVGKREHFIWNGEAERLGGADVDDEIEFGRLLYRQVACICPAQYLVDLVGGASE
jgi:hypothetical protein